MNLFCIILINYRFKYTILVGNLPEFMFQNQLQNVSHHALAKDRLRRANHLY